MLDDISLVVSPGEVVGLAGASGAGKSTLGRLLAGHYPPRQGEVLLDGSPLPGRGLAPVQWLPQTPELAINPRWTIRRILHEAWTPDPALCERFGIRATWRQRYPFELSGGELQRVAIVRALAPEVRYLIADEISAMLDAITQAQLWHALLELLQERSLGLLVISHDDALLRRLCSRCLRLESGRLLPHAP
ncbi:MULTISPECIES: ABC transporter ATP-binding protein [Halomonadaceae]|uniref:ABC transporter ATP-binding protein n=1 Tax=Halomonadaceae TaxID=28256 RepID=UPI00200FEF57|nr:MULTISPECIES: ATP-binding cassette domain-containing protein [Halomonas]